MVKDFNSSWFSSDNISLDECGEMPDLKTIGIWKFWIGGVATLVTGILGLIGNFVCLYILIYK